MAGPAKKRVQAESQATGSSENQSANSGRQSIPRNDGGRDRPEASSGQRRIVPVGQAAIERSDPRDLKNISEFLGLVGWYAARGVSDFSFSVCLANCSTGFEGCAGTHGGCKRSPQLSLHPIS